ncbi:hypothetical protein [Oceanitalea stevensii]|uniref:Uncharacterized protein n=1 Tax=Oceanitalea stevensii TaxID=2763072 RepID=A0ABR8Z6H8_9MICO|nr:hypothetical protein [Oceanitalea stevensii]MBD8063583.1 hypothetical protein [Oceanitalea stevensii]
MRLRRIAAASLVLSATVVLGPPALAADTGTAVRAASPPVAEPATFLGDLACQVLGDFFEKC